MKRAVSLFGSLFLMMVVLQLIGSRAGSADPTFTKGDVFVGVASGHVQWRHADGTLVQTLTTNSGTGFTTGMALDSTGKLYVTNFDANEVSKFNTDGSLAGTFGTGYDSDPESMLFNSSGHALVGQAGSTADVLEFGSAGNSVATYNPAPQNVGTDWIELAANQCTLYYTSEGTAIKRFDACENTQLSDFARLDGGTAFALRILPAGAGILVADRQQILLLDPTTGSVVNTYDAEGQDNWFALNLDPDGTSFWSADFGTADVYKFDIATGAVLLSFNTGTGTETVFGLAVAGEITVSQPQADLSITKSDGKPNPCPAEDPSNPESPPIPCGPDPVSSGQQVGYGVSVKNNGPAPATGVTMTDTPSEGSTVKSGSGTDWSCGSPAGNTLTCHYTGNEGVLLAGSTAPPITVLVQAPINPGSEDITMSDTASVQGNQSDPTPSNDTATETTTVEGSSSPSSKDHAAGFFDNVNTLRIATTRDTTGGFYSSLTIHPDPGLQPGVVSIDEFPATQPPYNTLCGGKPCHDQVQISGVPVGQAAANNAMRVHWFFTPDNLAGFSAMDGRRVRVWVKGDNEPKATVLKKCFTRGIANPPKCVNSIKKLKNDDLDIMLLWRDGGDPWGGKR